MQEIYRKIFKMACKEFPHKHFIFNIEEAVLYRGFKISLKKEVYYWQDTRNSNYYEPVDPLITKNVLKRGFYTALTLLMIHTDEEKIQLLNRDIFDIEKQISYWSLKSSENWRISKRNEKGIRSNDNLNNRQKQDKLFLLTNKYSLMKNLYIKKRRVLKEEQEELEGDYTFYLSRIKSYKKQKLWESTAWDQEEGPTKHSSISLQEK